MLAITKAAANGTNLLVGVFDLEVNVGMNALNLKDGKAIVHARKVSRTLFGDDLSITAELAWVSNLNAYFFSHMA